MKPLKYLTPILALAAASTATTAAFAAGAMEGMDMKAPMAAPHVVKPVSAQIKKIDAPSGKVTLKHGPIENLGMPAMTMAFPVKNPASLKAFAEGDLVMVTFDKVGGTPTVVDMHRQ